MILLQQYLVYRNYLPVLLLFSLLQHMLHHLDLYPHSLLGLHLLPQHLHVQFHHRPLLEPL